ncbi:MAG: hypothetical protein ABTQ24_09305 [Azonexus sp.]|jgi:hypothetical protein
MNELKQCLSNLQSARGEEGDPGFDEMLDSRMFAIMDILIERHQECRAEALACIAKAMR